MDHSETEPAEKVHVRRELLLRRPYSHFIPYLAIVAWWLIAHAKADGASRRGPRTSHKATQATGVYVTAQNRHAENLGATCKVTAGHCARGFFMRIAVLSLIVCLVPAVASAQCRSNYDFSALHLKAFSDPGLARVANALTSASMPAVIQQAKASGAEKKDLYAAVLAQAASSGQKSEESLAHAKALSAADGSMEHYLSVGLPADYTCAGEVNAAMCIGFINLWAKTSALQTAEAIACGW